MKVFTPKVAIDVAVRKYTFKEGTTNDNLSDLFSKWNDIRQKMGLHVCTRRKGFDSSGCRSVMCPRCAVSMRTACAHNIADWEYHVDRQFSVLEYRSVSNYPTDYLCMFEPNVTRKLTAKRIKTAKTVTTISSCHAVYGKDDIIGQWVNTRVGVIGYAPGIKIPRRRARLSDCETDAHVTYTVHDPSDLEDELLISVVLRSIGRIDSFIENFDVDIGAFLEDVSDSDILAYRNCKRVE